MLPYDPEKISWWEKFMTKRLGLVLLRKPIGSWPQELPQDLIMAFHYCEKCQAHRFDRHFDPLSQMERFYCGSCGLEHRTRCIAGYFFFYIMECGRTASREENLWKVWLVFWRLMFFGLGKNIPRDREGKTTGELELYAGWALITRMIDLAGFMEGLKYLK